MSSEPPTAKDLLSRAAAYFTANGREPDAKWFLDYFTWLGRPKPEREAERARTRVAQGDG